MSNPSPPERWCPFTYEFLPDFCFTCGRMGHVGRACTIKLKSGEKQQYGRWMKVVVNKRNPGEEERRSWGDGSGGAGRRYPGLGTGASRSGSGGASWRKDDRTLNEGDGELGEEREGTSPLKGTSSEKRSETQKMMLL